MLIGFDGAKIHFFPDIPAVSAEILALRGWEGEKKRAAIRQDHGDRLFEVNSTNSFKNLSP